jgi:uncharacterized RDD family membrane protein YckC
LSNNGSSPNPEGGTTNNHHVEVILASWTDRFVAWLIDFIIVSIGLAILFALLALPFWFSDYSNGTAVVQRTFKSFHYLLSSSIFFAYWTYFEHTSGQSIGKRILKLKSTDMSGKNIDIKNAALESFGKSFLLPIDVILGWLFTNSKRQRVFNKVSNTVVIKLKSGREQDENIRYRKD